MSLIVRQKPRTPNSLQWTVRYHSILKTCPCNQQDFFFFFFFFFFLGGGGGGGCKNENFHWKNYLFDIFLVFAQNIDCGHTLELPRRGGSNEYPQSMFWSKNKYTPANPSFLYKSGVYGVYISWTCFPDGMLQAPAL